MNTTVDNRIIDTFRAKQTGILSIYYTAGYPHLDDTVRIGVALEKAGADLLEIGIPFSDPVADGPTIQASNKVALDNGMNVKLLLKQVAELRAQVNIPIILMGYVNPVLQYGIEDFLKDAAAAGVDGLILPDLPMAEYLGDYKELFEKYGLCNTFLISPTTSEDRIRKIDAATHGFIYAVSATSITGARGEFSQTQTDYFKRLKNMKLHNPFLIGFGISNHATFSTACEYAAGAIVGSSFITLLASGGDFDKQIPAFIHALRNKS